MNSNLESTADLSLIERKLDRLVSLFVVVVGTFLFLLCGICLQIALAIPKFERIFAEMLGDKPLPASTQWVIGLGRLGDGTVLPACFAILPISALIYLVVRRHEPTAWIVAVATIIVLVIGAVLSVASLFLPLITIITEVGNQVI